MTSISMDGKTFSQETSDWSLWKRKTDNELMVSIELPSTKKVDKYVNCEIKPTIELTGNYLFDSDKSNVAHIDLAVEVGEKYILIKYPNSETSYIYRRDKIEIIEDMNLDSNSVFTYFKQIAEERVKNAPQREKAMNESVLNQFPKVNGYKGTALHAYLTGVNQEKTIPESFIFPFGINESQLHAVENAFSSQASIIEGPPGTGKTQTILNIICNILVQNKTVGIISNNNSAVENVYEKMEKENLDYLIAKLGNSKNQNDFFENMKERQHDKSINNAHITRDDIKQTFEKVRSILSSKNELAKLQAELSELQIEQDYLSNWLNQYHSRPIKFLFTSQLKFNKTVELITVLKNLPKEKTSILNRCILLFKYRILDTKSLSTLHSREEVISGLEYAYYEERINRLENSILELEDFLSLNNFESHLKSLRMDSMNYLKSFLNKKKTPNATQFNRKNFKGGFSNFVKRFPIIGSSSYSIVNSIGNNVLLDYVIVDEASQQDIVPGFLGLGVAKNIIVVGDRKQLPHIPQSAAIGCPNDAYNCEKHSLLDSFIHVFHKNIAVTLLKEHYRCHPKIIQFCNKQFYDNVLIPMTAHDESHPLKLIITAKGNHSRGLTNIRELESLMSTGLNAIESVGFIAPYNAQTNAAKEYLPQEYTRATVHKFQGRECNEIIFSTVLDKKKSNLNKIDFVDNPHLINVAVSRAKNKFTLITGNNVFERNNENIAALIRYIKYYASEDDIVESNVISSFDLLYAEYDQSLEKRRRKLRSKDSKHISERIIASVIRDILDEDAFKSLEYHMQIFLNRIVASNVTTKERELEFLFQGSSCDFVIYYKVGKMPIAVIEVDGPDHNKKEQQARDKMKDNLLHKAKVNILRLKTNEANEEYKIKQFLLETLKQEPY